MLLGGAEQETGTATSLRAWAEPQGWEWAVQATVAGAFEWTSGTEACWSLPRSFSGSLRILISAAMVRGCAAFNVPAVAPRPAGGHHTMNPATFLSSSELSDGLFRFEKFFFLL